MTCFVPLVAQQSPHAAWQQKNPAAASNKPPPLVPTTTTALQSTGTTTTTTTTSDDLLATVREGIAEMTGGNLEDWHAAVAVVETILDDNSDDAERVLADATRWTAWARAGKMARKYIKPEQAINAAQLQESLDWLQTTGPLNLTLDQVKQAIRQYPQLYLMDPAAKYKKVMEVAPRQFRDSLRDLILEDYSVLQFQYNCDNDCISECGNCWVTFQNRY